jgi:metalloprotease
MNVINLFTALILCMFLISGCENTDVQTAASAGVDALKAITLNDKDVQEIAIKYSQISDCKHIIAPPESKYAKRLNRIIGRNFQDGNLKFNYGVYISPEVNAFAMADGTIRLYSGLMDMLDDGELLFVIGHEMGHVKKNHVRKKIQLAYAASAVRKSIASQNSTAGDLARSTLGGLAETLANAQFSQLDEKEADDYGLAFLKLEKAQPQYSVSALKKIAKLGKGNSFLSSHPDPELRAERLQAQLEGKASSIEDNKQNIMNRIRGLWSYINKLIVSN